MSGLFFLSLTMSALAQEPVKTVKVSFKTSPAGVKVYQKSLQNFSEVEVQGGEGTLEFPGTFGKGDKPIEVRFSVALWGGLYPDWENCTPEERRRLHQEGFGLNVYYKEARDAGAVPVSNEWLTLPLSPWARFQAQTLAHPLTSLMLLVVAGAMGFAVTRLRLLPGAKKTAPRPESTEMPEDYTLGEKLGEGGMGEVWAATTSGQLRCALKFLRPELAKEEEFRVRLEREIEAWKALKHPHLLRFYGWGVARDGRLYTISELLEGRTLKQVIASKDYDPPQLASLVLEQIGDALLYLHQQKLVHRDVKPDNIFVCDNGDLKLMDMGLLRDSATIAKLAEVTKTGQILGTPAYMPPEQLGTESKITVAADQYALGIILYEILVGQRPFTQSEMVILAYQHAHVAPPRPSELNPRISPEVEQGLLRMLGKKPQERYASILEAQQALEPLRFTVWTDHGDETCHGRLPET